MVVAVFVLCIALGSLRGLGAAARSRPRCSPPRSGLLALAAWRCSTCSLDYAPYWAHAGAHLVPRRATPPSTRIHLQAFLALRSPILAIPVGALGRGAAADLPPPARRGRRSRRRRRPALRLEHGRLAARRAARRLRCCSSGSTSHHVYRIALGGGRARGGAAHGARCSRSPRRRAALLCWRRRSPASSLLPALGPERLAVGRLPHAQPQPDDFAVPAALLRSARPRHAHRLLRRRPDRLGRGARRRSARADPTASIVTNGKSDGSILERLPDDGAGRADPGAARDAGRSAAS